MKKGRPSGQPKTGGRVAGTPNKPTEKLMEICERLKCEPFEVLILFALGDWKALGYKKESYYVATGEGSGYDRLFIEPKDRLMAAKEAANYLYPKRKAIEHSGEVGLNHKLAERMAAARARVTKK